MTEQTNADLIDKLRIFAGEMQNPRASLMRDAADALEAADQRADEADRAQREDLSATGEERFYGMDLDEAIHPLPFGLDTHGIVDENAGGIIAFCHSENTVMLVGALRAQRPESLVVITSDGARYGTGGNTVAKLFDTVHACLDDGYSLGELRIEGVTQ